MASRSLGTLTLDLVAKIGGFTGPMDKAGRHADKRLKDMKRSAVAFGKDFAFSLGIAVAGFVAITKKSLDFADAIAKQSAQANIASGTFQELVFALDKFDISQEAVAKGLKTFTKQLGEARQGTGTLVTILGKYDKALLDNITSVNSNEAALNIFIKALGNVKNDADRAALAAAGFGRTAGVDMANALKDGGKGIDDWRQKARDLGIVLDDELLKGAEGAKDQLSALSTVLKVRLTAAVIELAPQIDQLTQNLIKVLPPLTEFIISLTSLGDIGLGVGFQSDIEGWEEQLKTAQGEVDNLKSAIEQLESPFSQPQPGVLDHLNEQLVLAEKNVIRLKRQFLVNDKPGQLGAVPKTPDADPIVVPIVIDDKAAAAAEKLADELFAARIAAMDAQSKEAEDLRKSLEDIRLAQLGWAQVVVDSLKEPTERIQDYRKELDEALSRGDISLEQHGKAYQKFADELLGATTDTVAEIEEVSQFWIEAQRNMLDAGSDVLYDALQGDLKTWEDYAGAFGEIVNRMLANWLAAQAQMAIFGDGKGGSGLAQLGLSALGAVGGMFSGGSGMNAPNAGPQLPSYAVGTPYVPQDMIAMIHKGEAIIPASENMMGRGFGKELNLPRIEREGDSMSYSPNFNLPESARRRDIVDLDARVLRVVEAWYRSHA